MKGDALKEFRFVDGYHIKGADFLSIKKVKSLPTDVKIWKNGYWLKPESEGTSCPYLDENGEIKEDSTLNGHWRRIVLTVVEDLPFASDYKTMQLGGINWYMISSHDLLMVDCDEEIDHYEVKIPKSNDFGYEGYEAWFCYHFARYDRIEIEEASMRIPDWADSVTDKLFINNQIIKSVTFPGKLSHIGNSAFENCGNLEEVIFEHNEHELRSGSHVFENCVKLKKAFFADWQTFWNYGHDTGGTPLSNGASLYVDGKMIQDFVIPEGVPEHVGISTLAGAEDINSICFYDGEQAVGLNYDGHYSITKESLTKQLFDKYPDLRETIKIRTNVCDLIDQASNYRTICASMDEIELWLPTDGK